MKRALMGLMGAAAIAAVALAPVAGANPNAGQLRPGGCCQRFRFACRVFRVGVVDGGGDAGDPGAGVGAVGSFLL